MASPEASTFRATMKREPRNSVSSLLGPQLSFLSHHSQPCRHKLPENKGTSLTLPSVPHLVCHQKQALVIWFTLVLSSDPHPSLLSSSRNSSKEPAGTPGQLLAKHPVPSSSSLTILFPVDTTSPAVLLSCNVSSLWPYLPCITGF